MALKLPSLYFYICRSDEHMNICSRCSILYFPSGEKLTVDDPHLKRHVNRYIAQRNYEMIIQHNWWKTYPQNCHYCFLKMNWGIQPLGSTIFYIWVIVSSSTAMEMNDFAKTKDPQVQSKVNTWIYKALITGVQIQQCQIFPKKKRLLLNLNWTVTLSTPTSTKGIQWNSSKSYKTFSTSVSLKVILVPSFRPNLRTTHTTLPLSYHSLHSFVP